MNNKTGLLILIVLVVLGGGAYFLSRQSAAPEGAMEKVEPTTAQGTNSMPVVNEATGASGAVMEKTVTKEFDVDGSNFSFSVKEIKVKQGDTVTINFTNKEGFHDWVIDEFSAKTPQIGAGKEASVTFVADKKGSFEYYCSVGSHRANGMVGKLIVE